MREQKLAGCIQEIHKRQTAHNITNLSSHYTADWSNSTKSGSVTFEHPFPSMHHSNVKALFPINAASNLRHPSLRCQVPLPWSSAKAKLCASANCLCSSQGDLNWFWTYTSITKCWEPTSCKPSHLPLLHEYPLSVKNKTLAQNQLRMNTLRRMTSKTQTVPKVCQRPIDSRENQCFHLNPREWSIAAVHPF